MADTTETVKVTTSPANSMSNQDWKKWWYDVVRFFLPVLAIYLGYAQDNLADGFNWWDFVPDSFVLGGISIYIISALQNLITKYGQEKKYIDGEKI